jgi:hypothetical protein
MMFQITVSRAGELPQRFDLHALPIAGTMAHNLAGADLYKAMTDLGISGITPNDGWQQLALRLAQYRADPSEAKQ